MGTVADDVPDGQVFERGVAAVPFHPDARDPLGGVRRTGVVVLVVVALDDAVHEMRVVGALEDDHQAGSPREAVQLQRGAVEVDREVGRDGDRVRVGHAEDGALGQHEAGDATGGRFVDEFLEPGGVRKRLGGDGGLVVVLAVDDRRTLPAVDDGLAFELGTEDDVPLAGTSTAAAAFFTADR